MLNEITSTLSNNNRKPYLNISILIFAQLFSKISDRLWLVGTSWYITEHYDKYSLAWFFAISMLPHLFLVFFSGQLIKRWSPFTTILYSEFARGIIYLSLIAVFLFSDSQFILFFLTIGTFLANCATALFNPALLTIPRQMSLKNSDRVIAMLNSCDSTARLIGPAIAIPVYALVKMEGLLFITGITYMLAWFAQCFIKLENNAYLFESRKLQELILHPFKLLNRYRLITHLLLTFFLTNIFLIPLQIFMPIIAKDLYQGSIVLLSSFEISLGAGLLIGGFMLSIYPLQTKPWRKIVLPYVLAGLAYLLFAYSEVSLISLGALFLLGFFLAIGNIATLNFYQKYVADSDIPDMMTYVNFISVSAGPIAMTLSGILLNLVPTQVLVVIYALLCLVIGLTMLFNRALMKLEND